VGARRRANRNLSGRRDHLTQGGGTDGGGRRQADAPTNHVALPHLRATGRRVAIATLLTVIADCPGDSRAQSLRADGRAQTLRVCRGHISNPIYRARGRPYPTRAWQADPYRVGAGLAPALGEVRGVRFSTHFAFRENLAYPVWQEEAH
jgi:hypothetical protein